jgi:hypothetical protein
VASVSSIRAKPAGSLRKDVGMDEIVLALNHFENGRFAKYVNIIQVSLGFRV